MRFVLNTEYAHLGQKLFDATAVSIAMRSHAIDAASIGNQSG